MSTITVRDNTLQVELDEVGIDYSTITEQNILRSAQQINFYGLSAKIVTHEQIADIYRTAYNRANNDKGKLLTRLKLLENDVPLDTPDPTLTELKALLLQHSDKRVCVVGTTCTGKSTLLAQIPGARDQDKEVFPKLTEAEKAYVCQTPWTEEIGQTMTQFVREKVLSEIGKPVFGTVVIDCDLIILLKISDELLANRVAQREAQFIDAKNMRTRIETEVRESGFAYTEFDVG